MTIRSIVYLLPALVEGGIGPPQIPVSLATGVSRLGHSTATSSEGYGQFPATQYPAFSASAALLNATRLCGATRRELYGVTSSPQRAILAVLSATPTTLWQLDQPIIPSQPLVLTSPTLQALCLLARTSDTTRHQPSFPSVWLTFVPSGSSTSAIPAPYLSLPSV